MLQCGAKNNPPQGAWAGLVDGATAATRALYGALVSACSGALALVRWCSACSGALALVRGAAYTLLTQVRLRSVCLCSVVRPGAAAGAGVALALSSAFALTLGVRRAFSFGVASWSSS